VRNQISAAIGDGNVHRLAKLCRLLLGDDDDSARIFKRNHKKPLSSLGWCQQLPRVRSAQWVDVSLVSTILYWNS